MEPNQLAIIIPALNEAKTIGEVVSKAKEYGLVIVVDDGSTDNTSEAASTAGALVVRLEKNQGYDAAINAGFKKASEINCPFGLTMDADGQHDSKLIKTFVSKLSDYDLVLGRRPKTQRLAESFFSGLTRLLFGIKDPLCGMKAYHMKYFHGLGHFDSYGSVGTELLLYALKNRARYVQIDIPAIERKDAPRFGKSLRGNLIILRAMLRGMYFYLTPRSLDLSVEKTLFRR